MRSNARRIGFRGVNPHSRSQRPTDDNDTFLVYTRWRSEDDFQNWMNSAAFQHGHKAHNSQGPVSNQSALWQFDVVQHEDAPAS